MKAYLQVESAGLYSTIQDQGRYHYEALGVPPSGAMDGVALSLANLIVGNPPQASALELTLVGGRYRLHLSPEIRSMRALLCIGGFVHAKAHLPNGVIRQLNPWRAYTLPNQTEIVIGKMVNSMRTYLTIYGGFNLPEVLGSQSTLTRAQLGGLAGRTLEKGDRLPFNVKPTVINFRKGKISLIQALYAKAPIRVIIGPQADYFSAATLEQFLASTYTLSGHSDRMAYCLAGPTLCHQKGADIISDAIMTGSIQIPGSGQPIIAMLDRQTTGGYPKIATVISADLPRLAQLVPGDSVTFRAVSLTQAAHYRQQQQRQIQEIEQMILAEDHNFSIFPLLGHQQAE